MPKQFKKMSRDQQELIYAALINNFASYLESKDTTPELMKYKTYWQEKAKDKLKAMYTKATREIRVEKPLEVFNVRVAETLNEIIPKEYELESKVDIITKDIDYHLRDFISDLAIELGSTQYFSLALKCCSMEKARLFITYCIDFFLDKEIPIDDELRDNLMRNEGEHYTISCLKKRICVITGKPGADIHHVNHIGTMGYKRKDRGDLLVLPLIREWHEQVDWKGDKWLIENYHLTPVPEKLAHGSYTLEEIQKEIENHKNPNKTTIKNRR